MVGTAIRRVQGLVWFDEKGTDPGTRLVKGKDLTTRDPKGVRKKEELEVLSRI